jgi:hypothetical protein
MDANADTLFGPEQPAYLAVVDDYGEIGGGATHARYVLAENNSEYVIKGPSLVDIPTVAANEWIAAELADKLGLPVLDHRFVEFGGELFFASTYMQKPSFAPAITEDLFRRCENRDRVYELVVFDAWLCNLDRHAENLIVRRVHRRSDVRRLVLNDHSHLLVSPYTPTLELLEARIDSFPSLYAQRLPFVRDEIKRAARLKEALTNVESLSDELIRRVVQSTPKPLLEAEMRDGYSRFLIARRSNLRALFQRDAGSFPNLAGTL